MRWKKNRKKIAAALVIAAVLAAAFWYGGDTPGARGWTAGAAAQETDRSVPDDGGSASGLPDLPPAEEKTAEGEAQNGESRPEDPDAPSPSHLEETDGPGTDPAPAQDTYGTDPVPDGRPAPVEPQDVTPSGEAQTCTLSISCASILDNMDWLDPDKTGLVPQDGWILGPVQVTFTPGESVFDLLLRVCREQGIHMEYEDTPMYNSAYIEGIANLYEFDCGELSGWMYSVNGWFPNYGCSRYQVQPGDTVCWVYTCDQGEDVGGSSAVAP
ncbi:MAG: DUF4430 domain-containing protein [Clostridia bacterium]|nr:DUF4430 domain-containing protein [Clostridia bacterium]